jgi:hypothetical protein
VSELARPVRVVNLGLEGFHQDLLAQGVESIHVDWRPPAGGDPELISLLARLQDPRVEAANAATLARLQESRPVWVDVARAGEAIPGLEPHTLLHSGPPIAFEDMCDPQQRALEGAALFEGLVRAPEELRPRLRRKEVVLRPNYELGSVGAMTGVVSASMPVVVVENAAAGNRSWSTFNEGKGNVIWMGAYDAATLERLRWMRDVLGPTLRQAVRLADGGLDVFKVIAEGLQMGDEVHARSAACTLLLLRWLVPLLLRTGVDAGVLRRVVEFLGGNNHSFLSLTIAAAKVTADAAHGVPHSTVVTAMSRNGIQFALRVGGAPGWTIAATAPMDEAIYYSGYTAADAAGDIGDSAIIETAGLGGLVIGAAPSVSSFVGGGMQRSREAMEAMRALCVGTNPRFAPAAVDFLQPGLGIDLRQVVRLGVTPLVDTGVLHKASGVGQIGTGVARAPLEVFHRALRAFPLPAPEPEVRP